MLAGAVGTARGLRAGRLIRRHSASAASASAFLPVDLQQHSTRWPPPALVQRMSWMWRARWISISRPGPTHLRRRSLSEAAAGTVERDARAELRPEVVGAAVRIVTDAEDHIRACQAVIAADRQRVTQ